MAAIGQVVVGIIANAEYVTVLDGVWLATAVNAVNAPAATCSVSFTEDPKLVRLNVPTTTAALPGDEYPAGVEIDTAWFAEPVTDTVHVAHTSRAPGTFTQNPAAVVIVAVVQVIVGVYAVGAPDV